MTPQPKRRHSHGRTHRRRAQDALVRMNLIECPKCHNAKLPHRVCPTCGTYNNAQVIEVES